MADRHEKRELLVFKAFAKKCSLSISPKSIEKKNPPKPDIQCELTDNRLLSFELVEIMDQGFANIFNKQLDTKKALSEYHSCLPDCKRVRFDEIFSNAMIWPEFPNRSTLRQRKNILPVVFNHLLTLDKAFSGDTSTTEHGDKLIAINIQRGGFNGPLFDLPAAGAYCDQSVSTIVSKFNKKYESEHPLHLLAYIDISPRSPKDIWLPAVEDFVKKSLQESQFEKIWIFDIQKNEITFIYP